MLDLIIANVLKRHINVDRGGHVHDIWLLKSFNTGFYLCGLWLLCNWICSIVQHTCKHNIWHWLHSDLCGTKLPQSLKDGIFKSARLNFSFLGIGFWIINIFYVCLPHRLIDDLHISCKLHEVTANWTNIFFVWDKQKRKPSWSAIQHPSFQEVPMASIFGGMKKVHLVVRSSV